MNRDTKAISAINFSIYAKTDSLIWDTVVGCTVSHCTEGSGKIMRVVQRPMYIPLIYVNDDMFNSDSFKDGTFVTIEVPLEIAVPFLDWEKEYISTVEEVRRKEEEIRLQQEKEQEKIRVQKEKEKQAESQFNTLKEKHNISTKISSPTSPLFTILLKFDDGETISDGDMQWLEKNSLYDVLAVCHNSTFEKNNDPWALVKCCSCLRKDQNPAKVIELTGKALEQKSYGSRPRAAVFTTRGAAFKDLSDLSQAEVCALNSIELDSTKPHAHNLLGAIYYQLGRPEDGDRHFTLAMELGGNATNQEYEIRRALDNAEINQQRKVAEYLLRKDPEKYHWATFYTAK